jgi:hypothetical protein
MNQISISVPSGHPTDCCQMKHLLIRQALECCGTHYDIAEDTALLADGQRRASCFACKIKSWSVQYGPCAKRSSPMPSPVLDENAHARQCGAKIELQTAYELLTNDFDGVLVRSQAYDRGCRSRCSGIHSRNSTAGTRRGVSQPDTLWGTSEAISSRLLAVRLHSC